MNIKFFWFAFSDLSPRDLYEILWLRQQVFVIEQACLYPDIDQNDPVAAHLIARDNSGAMIGCLRLLPPGITNDRPAIGRLAVAKPFRGREMGSRLMTEGIKNSRKLFADRSIFISAQHHLIPLYRKLGFTPRGKAYDEDGILHIDMILPAPETG